MESYRPCLTRKLLFCWNVYNETSFDCLLVSTFRIFSLLWNSQNSTKVRGIWYYFSVDPLRFYYFHFVCEFVEGTAGCVRDWFVWDEDTCWLLGYMERRPTRAGTEIFSSHKFTFPFEAPEVVTCCLPVMSGISWVTVRRRAVSVLRPVSGICRWSSF
jgi:hypothetical protein